MTSNSSIFIKFLLLQCLIVVCVSKGFDFFYFVQQWPGSYCDTQQNCCYPTAGKPATNFSIHGLWPIYNSGSHPSYCDSHNPYNESKISDLISRMQISWPTLACPSSNGSKFWSHEWNKHGTCSECVLDQHAYFEAGLNLKDQIDLLKILKNSGYPSLLIINVKSLMTFKGCSDITCGKCVFWNCLNKNPESDVTGIEPNGKSYSLFNITETIRRAVGYEPGVQCNVNEWGTSQLYQVYLCLDSSGSKVIKCPRLPDEGTGCASKIEFPAF